MRDSYDVLVAGAGPAGSEFAYRMARLGYRVLVLERGPLEREKPCGGGIQTQEIIEFGPLPDSVVERHIQTAKIVAPDGGILEVPKYLEACGATVKRSVYDRWLSKRAEQAGATFRPYCHVVAAELGDKSATVYAETPEGRVALNGRLLAVAAGGTAGRLTRSLGLKAFASENCAVAAQYWIALEKELIDERIGDTIEIYTGSSVISRGYAWIFPKRDVVTVGLGCEMAMLAKGQNSLRVRLDDFIENHPIASKKLLTGKIVHRDGGPIPFFIASRLTAPSTLLLGDAGGFGNAIHGGGIYQARKSAALAEPHAQAFLENGSSTSLDAYAEEAREHFSEYEGKWDVKMRPFFWEDDLVNVTVRRASEGDRQIVSAMGIILNSDRSHKDAYLMLEPRMLDLIHDCLRAKTRKYRAMVNEALDGLFQKDTILERVIRHILFADAKRVRASLALMATEAAGQEPESALPMGIGFELLHTASLIHDDIMDDAQTRRGRPCAHRVFGTELAITAGDALVFEAYQQILQLSSRYASDRLAAVLGIFGACAAQTCRGQADDLTFPHEDATMRQYLQMVRRKTGSMIEAPLQGGAVLGDAPPSWQRRFRQFGRDLGIAFQIVDDAIDYLGSEEKARKTLGNDLRRNKGSAMLIYCRQQCNREERDTMARSIEQFRISGNMVYLNAILELLRKYDAIGFTQRLCQFYVNRARRMIRDIGREPARTGLDEVAQIVGYWGLLSSRLPHDQKPQTKSVCRT